MKLNNVSQNFTVIDGWVNKFIENIENAEAKKLLREFWTEQKAEIDVKNFNLKLLLK